MRAIDIGYVPEILADRAITQLFAQSHAGTSWSDEDKRDFVFTGAQSGGLKRITRLWMTSCKEYFPANGCDPDIVIAQLAAGAWKLGMTDEFGKLLRQASGSQLKLLEQDPDYTDSVAGELLRRKNRNIKWTVAGAVGLGIGLYVAKKKGMLG